MTGRCGRARHDEPVATGTVGGVAGPTTDGGTDPSADPGADPFAVLGLGTAPTAADVTAARRRLSKRLHPDVGGSAEAMRRVNRAADEALRLLAARRPPIERGRSPEAMRHDHPSFTIEALPVEAFEGLLVVASWLGDVIDDDPPYHLEVAMTDPVRGWCRLDLVPDAGASTVSLAVAPEPGGVSPDVSLVRDVWIDGLNRLDWSDPARPRPPS